MLRLPVFLTVALFAVAIDAGEAPSPFPGSGLLGSDGQVVHSGQQIRNNEGETCTFTLFEYPEANFFHDSLTAVTQVLEFDDPSCMRKGDLGHIVNLSQINQRIAREYSHNDADWRVRPDNLHDGSLMQVRGQCIQSATYPTQGIAVAYVVVDKSITHVLHTTAVQGCQ